mmetsp:Transcript_43180/g.101505  ORF Transcript_43180/g.101505 Transcript_43180/m.101505 type:complete len:345 (+) Transcript_43180:101-1135(+)
MTMAMNMTMNMNSFSNNSAINAFSNSAAPLSLESLELFRVQAVAQQILDAEHEAILRQQRPPPSAGLAFLSEANGLPPPPVSAAAHPRAPPGLSCGAGHGPEPGLVPYTALAPAASEVPSPLLLRGGEVGFGGSVWAQNDADDERSLNHLLAAPQWRASSPGHRQPRSPLDHLLQPQEQHEVPSPQTPQTPAPFGSNSNNAAPVKKKGRLHAREVLSKGITTVMMHQIAPGITQKHLLQALEEQGFTGRYDFVYLPPARENHGGYAFINLCSPDVAAALVSKWAGKQFGDVGGAAPGAHNCKGIFFSIAAVQGYDANVEQIMKGTGARGRKANRLPYIAGGLPQ